MKRKDWDIQIARRILQEIGEVDEMLRTVDEKAFLASKVLQKATVMSLLNIGEFTKDFSDDLIDQTRWMPWRDIRSARNIAAHTYDALDMDDVWETYRADLPQMRREMEKLINRLENGWDPTKEARDKRRR